MLQRGRGCKIINIGSLMSEAARATTAPYTGAKGGIKMLSKAMAAEWAAHGIQANAIGPGYIHTDMNEKLVADPAFDVQAFAAALPPETGVAVCEDLGYPAERIAVGTGAEPPAPRGDLFVVVAGEF